MYLKAVLNLYPRLTFPERLLARYAYHSSPFERIERLFPDEGLILDLGCGWGLFANLLALRSPGREVIGIDLSAGRIQVALSSVGRRERIRFIQGDILHAELPACDAIAIIEVLYRLPRESQIEVLERCWHCLRGGGLLVIKPYTVKNSALFSRWKHAYASFHASFLYSSVNLLRTILNLLPARGPLYSARSFMEKLLGSTARSPAIWDEKQLMRKLFGIGFSVEPVLFKVWSMPPQVAYICRKYAGTDEGR